MSTKPTKINVSELLRSNNKRDIFPIKKSRSGIPHNDENQALADSVHDLYESFRQAETEFRAKESELIEKAKVLYEKNAKVGSFTKSVNFDGSKTLGMQVSFQDRFSNVPVDHENELKELMKKAGIDFDEYFQEKRILKLNDTSDETIELIRKKLGADLFLQIFGIDISFESKEDMDRDQFKLPAEVRAFLKQNKPSCKARIK